MPIELRPYEAAHLQPLLELAVNAWQPVFDSIRQHFDPALYDYYYPDWQMHQKSTVEKACQSPDLQVWVACREDKVVGFVAWRLDDSEKTGEIYLIAVDPAHQRQGIGAMLTDHATRKMQEAGMEICMLSTGADPGHGPARRSYEQSGFKPWHSVIYFKKLSAE